MMKVTCAKVATKDQARLAVIPFFTLVTFPRLASNVFRVATPKNMPTSLGRAALATPKLGGRAVPGSRAVLTPCRNWFRTFGEVGERLQLQSREPVCQWELVSGTGWSQSASCSNGLIVGEYDGSGPSAWPAWFRTAWPGLAYKGAY